MLNLFKLNIIKSNNKKEINIKENKYTYKNFPSSVREWNNSIYVYNKHLLNLIPVTVALTTKLIKSYFNLCNFKLERKMRKRKLMRRLKRLSSHKIYVSNGEFKHTNNKVLITLYLFNRQEHNYRLKIKKRYLKLFEIYSRKLTKKLKLIRYKGLNSLNKAEKKRSFLIKALNLNHTETISIEKSKILYSKYLPTFYSNIIKKSLRKIKIYLYYKQLLYINNSKFKFTYLQNLKNKLEILYNKNVEFNLVNLKYFYLNSDILSESITLKIKKNRRKLLRFLKRLIKKVKIHKKDLFISNVPNLSKNSLGLSKIILENEKSFKKEVSLKALVSSIAISKKKVFFKENLKNIRLKKNIVLDSINYKHVTGVRLEATGRLTKRYTASRAISKLRYKGNLINIDSSINKLSSVMLRNNLRSNLQYSKLTSKTRIGSFGIKGWVSGN